MRRTLVLSLILLYIRTAIASQDGGNSYNCNEISTSQQVFECSKTRAEAADHDLNIYYKWLIEKVRSDYSSNAELGKDLMSRLKNSQRAWLASRDANCLLDVFIVEKGSIAFDTTRNNCLYRESINRSSYLKSFGAGL